MRCSRTGRSGPSPAHTTRKPGTAARMRATASRRSTWPLRAKSAPSATTSGPGAGSRAANLDTCTPGCSTQTFAAGMPSRLTQRSRSSCDAHIRASAARSAADCASPQTGPRVQTTFARTRRAAGTPKRFAHLPCECTMRAPSRAAAAASRVTSATRGGQDTCSTATRYPGGASGTHASPARKGSTSRRTPTGWFTPSPEDSGVPKPDNKLRSRRARTGPAVRGAGEHLADQVSDQRGQDRPGLGAQLPAARLPRRPETGADEPQHPEEAHQPELAEHLQHQVVRHIAVTEDPVRVDRRVLAPGGEERAFADAEQRPLLEDPGRHLPGLEAPDDREVLAQHRVGLVPLPIADGREQERARGGDQDAGHRDRLPP